MTEISTGDEFLPLTAAELTLIAGRALRPDSLAEPARIRRNPRDPARQQDDELEVAFGFGVVAIGAKVGVFRRRRFGGKLRVPRKGPIRRHTWGTGRPG